MVVNMRGQSLLLVALLCFVLFFGNVMLGAARIGAPLGDVGEMVLLLVSTIFFVVGVLLRETAVRRREQGK